MHLIALATTCIWPAIQSASMAYIFIWGKMSYKKTIFNVFKAKSLLVHLFVLELSVNKDATGQEASDFACLLFFAPFFFTFCLLLLSLFVFGTHLMMLAASMCPTAIYYFSKQMAALLYRQKQYYWNKTKKTKQKLLFKLPLGHTARSKQSYSILLSSYSMDIVPVSLQRGRGWYRSSKRECH